MKEFLKKRLEQFLKKYVELFVRKKGGIRKKSWDAGNYKLMKLGFSRKNNLGRIPDNSGVILKEIPEELSERIR